MRRPWKAPQASGEGVGQTSAGVASGATLDVAEPSDKAGSRPARARPGQLGIPRFGAALQIGAKAQMLVHLRAR